MTESLSRADAVAATGLPLVRLEDLHGFDESTRQMLRRLAHQPAGVALLFLPGPGDDRFHGRDGREREASACFHRGSAALGRHQYVEAEQAFRSGLADCQTREPDGWIGGLTAGLAESLTGQGRYAEADAVLDRVRNGALAPAVRAAVSYVSGRSAVHRTGDDGGQLDEAWSLAERCGDDERMARVAGALAEAAWIAGRVEDTTTAAHRGRQLAIERSDAWALSELNWWMWRAGSGPAGPAPATGPFRFMLEGDWRAAADAWLARGSILWAAYALSCSPSPADARRALTMAEDAGAVAAREAMARERRAAGLGVPPRPRSATRANPHQLTRRELEILGLLTRGLTNPQIAHRLYLSERTVAHHVSAVLQKLGQPNRSAAAATAVRHGIVAAAEAAADLRPS